MSSWRMPAEFEPHECSWMAWPSAGYTLGTTDAEAEAARTTWAKVASAIAEFEPLHLLVPPAELAAARRHLTPDVVVHDTPLDDGWYRDIGPTFVLRDDGDGDGPAGPGSAGGSGEPVLGAVNWVFNGWGGQDWASWEHDSVASEVATAWSEAQRIASPLVNEGGGIHTDGAGTFLVTETVQLDPGRNPGWTKDRVEAELARTLGARKVIWLPRGLTRDSERFGTRGHVDIVATFPSAGRVLVHDQRDARHPDSEVSREALKLLADAEDAAGRRLEVIPLPAPATLSDEDGWVDYSYVNHYVVNKAVVACVFEDPHDDAALAILAGAYPGRTIVPIDARPLFARGGGVHCITQQQPAVPGENA